MFKWLKRQPAAPAPEIAPPPPPTRLYVISGTCTRPYKEPSYSTDLRVYGMRLKAGVTDEEYEKAKANRKAFINRNDAITFAYHCNLDGVMCPVYDKVGDDWEYQRS